MAVALDSSVVVGFLDRGDALHRAADRRVRELLAAGEGLVTSAVTYAEVLTGAKLGHHDEQIVHGFFDDLISEVIVVDARVAALAADLRAARRSLKMPDALIFAGAEHHPGVERIVCADDDGQKVRGLLDAKLELLTPQT